MQQNFAKIKTPQQYALFDIDKTVTSEDTFMLLIKCTLKENPHRIIFFILFMPVFFATMFLNLDKRWAKSCVLWSITFGKSPSKASRYLKTHIARRASTLWLAAAKQEILQLQSAGLQIVFVTASAGLWIEPLLEEAGLQNCPLICSTTAWKFGGFVYTSKNCYGNEKINRLNKELPSDWKDRCLRGYSDSPADIPMLKVCRHRFLISPSAKQMHIFARNLGREHTQILPWRA